MNKEKVWTKDFIIVSIANFVTFLVFLLLLVIIAPYAVDKYNASTSVAGLVAGIFIIGALIGRLGTGRIIEDMGSRRVLIAGSLFFIIATALYFAAINLPLLIIIRLLHGIAFGIVSTASGTIVVQIIPGSKRGEGIGYFSMSAMLTLALGPFIGIFLIQHTNFTTIFVFNLVLAVISFAISFAVNEPAYKSPGADQAKTAKSFPMANYFELKALPLSIISLIVCLSYSGIVPFISLYTKQLQLEEIASFYFLVYAVTVLVSRPFSGRLLDVKGENFIMYPCLFIFAAGMLLFSQASHGITLLSAAILIGLGFGNFLTCAQAISIKVVPPHRLGLATSTYFIFTDLGLGAGPFLLGFLIPFTGYRGLYLLMVILILATTVLYYFLHGRKAAAK
ncbi:MAG: Multidrug resistance protein MdtL [Smithella sp. PtaU1.Bin162]|nr:MAG: Multidrug resistance protein MdtL [Smithella sp. PtaU1.Bin162]